MDTPSVQTVKQLVKDIIAENGFDQSNWTYVYSQALNALRDVHMFHTKKYQVIKVSVDIQTNTIEWPDDFLGLVFLAIPIAGRLWKLTRDDGIITTTTLVNGQETLDTVAGEGVQKPDGQVWGYGAHGGQNTAYYTEDENNRRFVINGSSVSNVLLGYVSSGVSDKDTWVPIIYKDTIHMFVRWRMNLRIPVNKVDADYFKDLYEQAANKLTAFEAPTMDEFYDAVLKSSTQTIMR